MRRVARVAPARSQFASVRHVAAGNFHPDSTRISSCEPEQFTCYEQAFGNLAFDEGPQVAAARVGTMLAHDDPAVRADCHTIMHAVGSATLARYDGDAARAMARGSMLCGSGFYHGIVMFALRATSSKPQLVARVRTMCSDPAVLKTTFLRYQCVHGLGHGLMIFSGDNLPWSLGMCDKLADHWSQQSCSGGVFMQNFNLPSRMSPFRSTYVRKKDPLYPCDWSGVQTRYKYYCYLQVTEHVLYATGYDWKRTAATCAKAQSPWSNICFQSFGRDVAGDSRYRPRRCVQALSADGPFPRGLRLRRRARLRQQRRARAARVAVLRAGAVPAQGLLLLRDRDDPRDLREPRSDGSDMSQPHAGVQPAVPRLSRRPRPAVARHGPVLKRAVLIVAVAVALPTLVAIRQVDGVLASLHPPREQSYRASSLTDFGLHRPKAEHVSDALQTWHRASVRHQPIGSATPFRSPSFVVHSYFALDFLFIVAYTLLLLAALSLIKGCLPEIPVSPTVSETHPGRVRRERFRQLVAHASKLVVALAVVDVIENAVSLHNASGLDGALQAPSEAWIWIGWLASWTKFALALLIVGPALVALFEIWKGSETSGRAVARTVGVVRGHVLILALFAVAFVGPIASEQAADVIRRWSSDQSSAFLASLLTLWFAATLFVSARWHIAAVAIDARSSRRNRTPGARYPGERLPRPSLKYFLALGVVLGVVAGACQLILGSGIGLLIPAVMLVLLTGLSKWVSGFPMPRRWDYELGGTRSVPALLLALPLVLLGLGVVGASVDEIVYANHPFEKLILEGLALQAIGWGLFVFASTLPDPNVQPTGVELLDEGVVDPVSSQRLELQETLGLVLGVSGAVAFYLVLWIWLKPFALPDAIGLVGVLSLFLVCVTLLTHAALGFSHRVEPLEAFRAVQLNRTPVVVLVLIWAVVAGVLAAPGYEDVRVDHATERERGHSTRRGGAGRTRSRRATGFCDTGALRRRVRWRDSRRLLDGHRASLRPRRPAPVRTRHEWEAEHLRRRRQRARNRAGSAVCRERNLGRKRRARDLCRARAGRGGGRVRMADDPLGS